MKLFFLVCVLIAGVYGAATVSRKLFFVQGMPPAIGIALVMLT